MKGRGYKDQPVYVHMYGRRVHPRAWQASRACISVEPSPMVLFKHRYIKSIELICMEHGEMEVLADMHTCAKARSSTLRCNAHSNSSEGTASMARPLGSPCTARNTHFWGHTHPPSLLGNILQHATCQQLGFTSLWERSILSLPLPRTQDMQYYTFLARCCIDIGCVLHQGFLHQGFDRRRPLM